VIYCEEIYFICFSNARDWDCRINSSSSEARERRVFRGCQGNFINGTLAVAVEEFGLFLALESVVVKTFPGFAFAQTPMWCLKISVVLTFGRFQLAAAKCLLEAEGMY
jgi:hypothetical protein